MGRLYYPAGDYKGDAEKARTENAAPSGRGGNGENGKRGTKVQGWTVCR